MPEYNLSDAEMEQLIDGEAVEVNDEIVVSNTSGWDSRTGMHNLHAPTTKFELLQRGELDEITCPQFDFTLTYEPLETVEMAKEDIIDAVENGDPIKLPDHNIEIQPTTEEDVWGEARRYLNENNDFNGGVIKQFGDNERRGYSEYLYVFHSEAYTGRIDTPEGWVALRSEDRQGFVFVPTEIETLQ